MKFPFQKKIDVTIPLILVFAAVLRFYGLNNQSFWVDELHTMNEADPSISWSLMFDYLKCCDQHPPLFFIIERFLFTLFGQSEWIARSLSAVCGVVSVYTMYLLGKEILNKDLGLIAALLTSVNYFNIQYSQEARCYIMAFLFTTLSFLYFIKLIKGLQIRDLWLYVLFTLLLLYSHYYSLFIVVSQGVAAFILLLNDTEHQKLFLKRFSIAGALIAIGYLPWIPFVIQMSKISSFWTGHVEENFAINYFFDYFGNSDLLMPFLILFLLYYCFHVFNQPNSVTNSIKENPLQLSFLLFFVAIIVTYLIPYLRSVLIVPMLFNRYTIVLLPCFIMAISFGTSLIHNRIIKITLLVTFVILSLINIIVLMRYYFPSSIRKSQFREMTQFIAEDKANKYTIVEEKTAWQHGYYLRKNNYEVPILAGNKEATIDSILNKRNSQYDLNSFWLVGAHGMEPHLREDVQKRLEETYTLVKDREFYDAWAQLYIRNGNFENITTYFKGKTTIASEMVIPIWGGSIESETIRIKPGHYSILMTQRGTKYKNVYPHVNVYLNKTKIGSFYADAFFNMRNFSFKILKEGHYTWRFELDNDNAGDGEDRNVFIKNVLLEKR